MEWHPISARPNSRRQSATKSKQRNSAWEEASPALAFGQMDGRTDGGTKQP